MTTPQIATDSVVIGRSARMRAVFAFLRVIGSRDSTVLVTGESGTGKEVTARMIHQNSRRNHQPFVAVSCALFSETLIESELFGHERGAFTGAISDRAGRFELADGGTMFLDDIDDVPLSMQVKLLRVLQNRTIERLGGTRVVPVNVRVIAGSKRDLKHLVANGRFRVMDHFLGRYFRRRNQEMPVVSVSGGNKSRAAELLQIKRSTLSDRINRLGLGALGDVATFRHPSFE